MIYAIGFTNGFVSGGVVGFVATVALAYDLGRRKRDAVEKSGDGKEAGNDGIED